jgi:hypothetical protein
MTGGASQPALARVSARSGWTVAAAAGAASALVPPQPAVTAAAAAHAAAARTMEAGARTDGPR